MLKIPFSFVFDPLSIFFLIIIIAISISSFIYSWGYLQGHYSTAKIILGQILFVLFVFSMIAVVTAGNIFLFLIVWEIMSLVSYFLVIFDTENKKSIEAGTIYMVMTQVGTAFLLMAFLLMYRAAGSFDFNAIHAALITMSAKQKNIIFLLLLAGFGTKAGIVPLHIWLPIAHPQASSHVSSLMSGVMIKTAVYGLIRFGIIILGVNSLWWGELIVVLACVSCLVGVIYALMENDIKTLLAYSSVENMGIILLGIGSAMIFIKLGFTVLAVLAMCAGLYHLINHAIFKGLLFLGAGSVYRATGTRNIERMGGLIQKLPWTSIYFLIGSMAISALPPLNGFVSEWLILIVFFLGALAITGGLKLFFCLAAGALALTSGLTAACFVKAFGLPFLGRARSAKAENAKEVPWSMNLGAGLLALLTILLSLGAVYTVRFLVGVSGFVLAVNTSQINFSLNRFILSPQIGGTINLSTPILALILLLAGSGAFILFYLLYGKARVVIGQTWDCGYYKLTSRNEYTATGFSKPFRLAFSFFLLPFRKVTKIKESRYHVKSFSYETKTTKVFREYLYKTILGGAFGVSRNMRGLQLGSIHIYLGYICLTLLLLIIFVGKF
ncbi:hydrogenase 4 subunit B [Candidatus Saganbacteria bacterium]|nr:hydrogenase 4 subunit B [Candidatus Saganbacteria bacterium]